MSMRVYIGTLLRCGPERAWQEVQRPALLRYITHPLVHFEPIAPNTFPPAWREGRYRVRMRLFGILPGGTQWIVIRLKVSPGIYELFDDGQGDLIAHWRHHITLRPTPEGFTHYTDTVDIEAGLLTWGVWLYANVLFRYRQSRWRRLVENHFDYAKT